MNPTRIVLIAAGVLVSLTLVALAGTGYSVANDWAAIVDDHEISERDFLEELGQFRKNEGLAQFFPGLGQSQQGAVPSDLASVWLGRLIQQELVDRIFAERGLTVTDAHRQQAEQINLQQFQGESVWQSFEPWFRQRMLDRDARFIAVVEAVGGQPTEAQLREAYVANQESFLQACSAHILVETLAEAQAIRAQLDAGADFAELAAEHSIDPGSGAQGGDLGCQRRGSFVEPFDSQVFTLPLNTVSEPIQTQFGFHLMLVSSRDVAPFEEVRGELEQQVAGQAQQELGQVLFDLVAEAEITVNPKYGTFEISPSGPQVLPPTPPSPPDGLPVDGELPGTGIPEFEFTPPPSP